MKRFSSVLILAPLIAGLLLSACTPASTTMEAVKPVVVEHIEGSDFSRVILTEKAIERLGLQYDLVREETATRKQAFSGVVMQPQFIPVTGADVEAAPVSANQQTAADMVAQNTRAFVYLSLIQSELQQIKRDEPAIIYLPGQDASSGTQSNEISTDEMASLDFAGINENSLIFTLDGSQQTLAPGQHVLVELSLAGSGMQRKVVPYDSVIYGLQGETWVYTNPEPLVFVRQPIVIDYVSGNMAFLTEGPDAGTTIVTVGVAMLYGAESGVGGSGGH